METGEALKNVLEKIRSSAVRADRDPDEIKLIAVSKTVELERVIEAVRAGAAILGENRVQEAKAKIEGFRELAPDLKPEWHLIGSLQKNKAKTAVQLFDLIHSVDSEELAAELNRHAENDGRVQDILAQVKLSEEAAKHGTPEKELRDLLDAIKGMDSLNLRGLMTIPPFFDDPEEARPYFRKLRRIAEDFSAEGFPLRELSMGMSNDYEVAIEEGATMVRVGTAIFGERQR